MNTRQKIENAALAALVMIAGSGAAVLGAWTQARGDKHRGGVRGKD